MKSRIALTAACLATASLAVLPAATQPATGATNQQAGTHASADRGKAKQPKVKNGCLTSVPDPGTTAPVKICYTIFRPARARAGAKKKFKLPMLIHSHGWGGSREKDPATFKRFLDAG